MHRHELTHEERVRILAGMVRNNMSTTTIFSPWILLDLAFHDGNLCRTSSHVGHYDRQFDPIMSADEVMEMNDDEIYRKVEG